MTLGQITEILEDPDYSDYSAANIYLCLPETEDPGDEDCQDPDHLSRNQLQSEAEVHFEGSNVSEYVQEFTSASHDYFQDKNYIPSANNVDMPTTNVSTPTISSTFSLQAMCSSTARYMLRILP